MKGLASDVWDKNHWRKRSFRKDSRLGLAAKKLGECCKARYVHRYVRYLCYVPMYVCMYSTYIPTYVGLLQIYAQGGAETPHRAAQRNGTDGRPGIYLSSQH